jgi:hypothetical protein
VLSVVTTGNTAANSLARHFNTDSYNFKGGVAELIIYDWPLTATEVSQVTSYLLTKYKITPGGGGGASLSSGATPQPMSLSGSVNATAPIQVQAIDENGVAVATVRTTSNGDFRMQVPAGAYRLVAFDPAAGRTWVALADSRRGDATATFAPLEAEHVGRVHVTCSTEPSGEPPLFQVVSKWAGPTWSLNERHLQPASMATTTFEGIPIGQVEVQLLTPWPQIQAGLLSAGEELFFSFDCARKPALGVSK